MDKLILKTAENIGHIYFLFVLALVVSNSIVRHISDEGKTGETRIIVAIVSTVMILTFACLGAEIIRLIKYTFIVFGVFSFFGELIERAYMWVYFLLYDWIVKAWTFIKSLFQK